MLENLLRTFFSDHFVNKLQWYIRGNTYHAEQISEAYLQAYDHIADLILQEKPNRILEYGCGYAFLLKKIYEKNTNNYIKEFFGTDYSATQIKNAIKKFPESKFTVADLCSKTSYEDNFFDVMVGLGVLLCIPPSKIELAIAELHRICAGKIFIVEYYYKYLPDHKKTAYDNTKDKYIHDYEELLRKQGFRNVQTFPIEAFANKTINILDEMPHTLVIAEK